MAIVSKCGDVTIRVFRPEQAVKAYEKLAYDAERAGDYALSQLYFNYAEHYKKEYTPMLEKNII